jgi:hypothetical protein
MTYSPQSPICDSARPHTGAMITAKEIRDLINSATAFNSSASQAPSLGESVLIADVGFTTEMLPAGYNEIVFSVISPDGSETSITSTILEGATSAIDVVDAISTGFATSPDVSQYVNVSSITDDPTGRTRIVITVSGGRVLRVDSATNNIEKLLLGVSLRNPSGNLPYTVPQSNPLHGTPYLSRYSGESSLYVNTPARIVGVPITSNITGNLRIRLKVAGSESQLDISLTNLSANQIASQINSSFSSFFTSLTGSVFDSYEVAKVNAGRVVLSLDGAATSDEYFNANTEIGISGLNGSGQRIINDVAYDVFGLLPRRGTSEYVVSNSRNVSFLRGVPVAAGYTEYTGSRGAIGIGYIGAAFGSKADIGESGEDFEIRYDAHTAIPWAYDGNSQTWSRAIPAVSSAIRYDKDREAYALLDTNATYVPDYLSIGNSAIKTGSTSWSRSALAAGAYECGTIGDLPRLIDVRSTLGVGNYSNNFTDGRRTFLSLPIMSDCKTRSFQRADVHGIPYLGDVAVMQGTGGSIGATSEAMVVTAAVGTVRQQNASPSGLSVIASMEGSNDIPSGRLVRVLTSYSNRNADREAIDVNWSAQVAQFVAPPAGGTSAGSLYAQSALPQGWSSAFLAGVTNDDYGVAITYNAGSVPTTESPIIVSVVPETSGLPWVSATLRTTNTPTDVNTRAGVVVSSDYDLTSGLNGWDSGALGVTTLTVTIDAGGVGGIWLTAGDGTNPLFILLDSFAVDAPLDEVPKTLRAIVTLNGSNPVLNIYWGGSESYDIHSSDEMPEAMETFSRGGVEGDQRTPILVHSYELTAGTAQADLARGSNVNNSSYLGALPGIYVDPNGSDAVIVSNFHTIGFSKRQTEEPIVGLPPVSGARLRDTLSAVTVLLNGTHQGVGAGNHPFYITDCNAVDPLKLNLTGDLALTNLSWKNGVPSSVISYSQDPGRTINIGFELNELTSFKEPRFWPSPGNFGSGGNVSPLSPSDAAYGGNYTTLSPTLASNSRSSKTTWDLGDYVLTSGIGYNGFSWVATGHAASAANQKYTILAAGNKTSNYTKPGTKGSNTYRLGRACDIATISSGVTEVNETTYAARYGIIQSYNRLVLPPDGYWAPFGSNTTTVPDNGFSNGIADGTPVTISRVVPLSLRTNETKIFHAGGVAGSGGINYITLDKGAGAGTVNLIESNGWWASIPQVSNQSITTNSTVVTDDDFCVTRNRHGALSVTEAADTIMALNFLHSSADSKRIYCTPTWTPKLTRLVYAFLTTMPSKAYHQSSNAYNASTDLRYEVDCAEVDYAMSTWLGNSKNIEGHTSSDILNYSGGRWVPTGRLASGHAFKVLTLGSGGNTGASGHHIATDITWNGTPHRVIRRTSPYGATPSIGQMKASEGYYDLFSSAYPLTDDDQNIAVDSTPSTWYQGKQIIPPHITEVTFAQPGEVGSITQSGNPFVTVLVSIEYHGPVVPTGIRLRTSAIAMPV